MATKAEIANDLRHIFGKSCISITDVAKYTGVNWEQAKRDLEKVPYIITGEKNKGRRYLVIDVAKMLFVKQVRM